MVNINPVISYFNKQQEVTQKHRAAQKWGVGKRNRLVSILENSGATITNSVYDLLLYCVLDIQINENGKLIYLSNGNPSKKVNKIFQEYSQVIKDNYNTIMAG